MIKTLQENIEGIIKNQKLMMIVAGVASVFLLVLPLMMGDIGEESPWLNFLGAFHPLVLHLPIGSLILVATIEFINVLTKDYKMDMTIPLIFNAGTSFVAAFLGVLWYYGGDFGESELIESHMWKGVIYSVCAAWLPLVYGFVKAKMAYYGLLAGSVVMMNVAAHDGGESTHGDPFDKFPGKSEKEEKTKPAGEGEGEVETVHDPLVFQELVVPIFEEKCFSCHHSSKKVKSGFKMDTFADIMAGGNEQEDYPALTPGDIENSFILESIELPEDDDLHMPPSNKKQITADELKILKWWVAIGAPEVKKLSEVDVPEDMQALVGAGAKPAEAAVETTQGDDSHGGENKIAVTPKNSPLAPQVKEFLKKYPNALSWTSLSDSTLYFSAASQRKSYKDEDLMALEPFVSELNEINLSDTQISDSVAALVKKSTKLKVLKLANTKVTNSLVKEIAANPTLEVLVLHSTGITDDAMMDIASIPNLKKVFLWNSKVTAAGVKKLSEARPELEVNSGL